MILWCDGGHCARENMRRDARLLARLDAAAADSSAAEPVMRLFRFSPAGITLGRAQQADRTLDLERCRADGVEWAVRPTGGRAIYHDDAWTYSFAARVDDPEWGGSLRVSYERVSRLVQASLANLGVPAELLATRGSRAGPARADDAAFPGDPLRPSCFASTSRHEIELAGRKLVGSAQRRTARALLQQGCVLLGDSHLRLGDYLRVAGDDRERVRRALAANVMPCGRYLGPDRSIDRWAAALAGVPGIRVRRCSGPQGGFLLTPGEGGSYTAGLPDPGAS